MPIDKQKTFELKEAERGRTAAIKLAKAQKTLAAQTLKSLKADDHVKRAESNLQLAENQQKRSFLTGRVIDVKGSQRARAHKRHWWSSQTTVTRYNPAMPAPADNSGE